MKHPLELISADEINIAVDLCRSYEGFDENALFINISLVEPEKEFVRNYKQGDDCPCLLYTSPSPRDGLLSRMPSSA